MRDVQVRAFDAVARHRSFTKAARALGVTQSAVTVQVRALEEAHGVQLFHRSTAGVSLTAEGEIFLNLARDMLAAEERARDFLQGSGTLAMGELRVSADEPRLALDLIAAFTANHPGVEVTLTQGNAEEIWHRLFDHGADIVVAARGRPDKRVTSLPVARQTVRLLVRDDHPWAGRRVAIPLPEIADQPLLFRERTSNTQTLARRALAAARLSPKPKMILESREAVQAGVAKGLGVGFVLDREIGPDPRLRALEIDSDGLTSTDVVAALRSQTKRRVIETFFTIARDYQREETP